MVGPLTDKSQIAAISADLESAGVDVATVEVLCGEQGARILDQDGRYHGLRARIVRALQRFGYDAGVVVVVTGAAIAFVAGAVRRYRRESDVYRRFRRQLLAGSRQRPARQIIGVPRALP